jgi:hypothetical protein
MIKATGVITDPAGTRPVLFMCLLPENTRRLQEGDPIMFEAAALGLAPLRLVIMYERDAGAVRARLAPMMRPDARHSPETLDDQAVDWRAIAAMLAESITLAAVPADGPPPPVLAGALASYAAAREREGL